MVPAYTETQRKTQTGVGNMDAGLPGTGFLGSDVKYVHMGDTPMRPICHWFVGKTTSTDIHVGVA